MNANSSGTSPIDYTSLAKRLSSASKDEQLKAVVDAPFSNKLDMAFLFLGFICLYIVDEATDDIQFMAASGTEEYRLAVERYNFDPAKFQLHFDVDKDNTIVQAIASGKPKDTTDWVTLSRKDASDEVVRLNQANSGIAYTVIYPLKSPLRGALMFNFYQYPDKIDGHQTAFMEKYTELVSTFLSQQSLND